MSNVRTHLFFTSELQSLALWLFWCRNRKVAYQPESFLMTQLRNSTVIESVD